MAYSNSSAAYDLSAYENVPKARQKQQVKLKVVKNAKKRQAALATLLAPKVFSSFAVVITLLCLIVYNQARLTEITGDINKVNNQIQTLESEYIIMQSRLESTMSLRYIEEIAQQELGMQKRDTFNTEYVLLFEEDNIEMTADSPQEGLLQKAKVALNSAVNSLKEYIEKQ